MQEIGGILADVFKNYPSNRGISAMRRVLYVVAVLGAAMATMPAHAVTPPSLTDDPRFTRVLEYELMSECVGGSRREAKIWACACALEKTQENGWGPDFDNDGDYREDMNSFTRKFERNIRHFANNMDECKRK